MKKTNSSQALDVLHVAVGVIKNAAGEILISQRPAHVHQGGLWEFPGGKVESGESVIDALRRELREELGIEVSRCEPLIKVCYDYPELSVLLDAWTVTEFSGTAYGREDQKIRWITVQELENYDFPAPNRPIINAMLLPCFYAILDDSTPADLMPNLKKILAKDVKLIQARLKNLSASETEEFIQQALPLCEQYQAQLLINSEVKNALQLECDGLHLTSYDLMRQANRPKINGWLAASCHNLPELRYAEKIGVDFVVLAPILSTPTHPNDPVLGWERFTDLVTQVNIPVYALGGVSCEDIGTVKALGGQGVAGIRTFLS